jgi:hypothetical protein
MFTVPVVAAGSLELVALMDVATAPLGRGDAEVPSLVCGATVVFDTALRSAGGARWPIGCTSVALSQWSCLLQVSCALTMYIFLCQSTIRKDKRVKESWQRLGNDRKRHETGDELCNAIRKDTQNLRSASQWRTLLTLAMRKVSDRNSQEIWRTWNIEGMKVLSHK